MIGVIAGVAGGALAGIAGAGFALTRPLSKPLASEPYPEPAVSTRQLEIVAGLTVFFGHQSVGGNVVSALPQVFAAGGVGPPEIVEGDRLPPSRGPVFLHAKVGKNRDPLGKLAAFDRAVRGGLGETLDVGVVKFCYADVFESTNVEELFSAHRDTISALRRDFPRVAFVGATVPLTVEPDDAVAVAKERVKRLLGRDSSVHPAHNVARERYNAMIREEYGATGTVWDIAAVESAAGGRRRPRTYGRNPLYAMERAHASDPGHLNEGGSAAAGRALLATIADAVTAARPGGASARATDI